MAEVDNSWAYDFENKIFTIVKTKALKKLKSKYPDINFTTSNNNSDDNPKFPCVYIHQLGSTESGNDLENNTINALYVTFQIETYSKTSQRDAKYVMSIVGDIFKSYGFSINEFPEFNNESSVYRCVMRVQRLVGSADEIVIK